MGDSGKQIYLKNKKATKKHRSIQNWNVLENLLKFTQVKGMFIFTV